MGEHTLGGRANDDGALALPRERRVLQFQRVVDAVFSQQVRYWTRCNDVLKREDSRKSENSKFKIC